MALCPNIADVKERIVAQLPFERKLVMLGVREDGSCTSIPGELEMGRNWGQFTFGSGLEADTFGGGKHFGKALPFAESRGAINKRSCE